MPFPFLLVVMLLAAIFAIGFICVGCKDKDKDLIAILIGSLIGFFLVLTPIAWMYEAWEQDEITIGYYVVQKDRQADGTYIQYVRAGEHWNSPSLNVTEKLTKIVPDGTYIRIYRYQPYKKWINWMNGEISQIDPKIITPSHPYYGKIIIEQKIQKGGHLW